MNIIIPDKTLVTFFSIEPNGDMIIKYGKTGEVRMEYKGYAVNDGESGLQVRLFCSELSVFIYPKSFIKQFANLEELLSYLRASDLALKKDSSTPNVVLDAGSLDAVDMTALHKVLENSSGLQIEF